MSDQKTIAFYDEYVARQVKMGINHRHISIINLLEQHGLVSTHDVLEIGSGVGTATKLIASIVKKGRIVANDISAESLEAAKDILKDKKNISFIPGSILTEEVTGAFDWIVLPDVLEHIPLSEHEALFKKLAGLLKPTGKILIHIPNPHYLAWVHENKPELLQEIDQPIYLAELLENLSISGLQVTKMKDYSIFVKPFDYRYLILEHSFNGDYVSSGSRSHTLMEKIKFKLKFG